MPQCTPEGQGQQGMSSNAAGAVAADTRLPVVQKRAPPDLVLLLHTWTGHIELSIPRCRFNNR